MWKIKGLFAEAKVYTKEVEETAIQQIRDITNSVIAKESNIAIMPDVHAGKGCTIGTTMTITDVIAPSLVGCDIGCGVWTVNLGVKEIDFAEVDNWIKTNIPAGQKIHDKQQKLPSTIELFLQEFEQKTGRQFSQKIKQSLGTLGGGNHFIEIDKDAQGNGDLYLTIHSGSRNLGVQVEKYFTKIAEQETKEWWKNCIQLNILSTPKQLRQQRIQEVKAAVNMFTKIPFLCLKQSISDYLKAVKVCQQFSNLNKMKMYHDFFKHFSITPKAWIKSMHNYIGEDNILRKGAISARLGEPVVIPLNMAEGVIIGQGRGLAKWNYSAPHGAGRKMSRKEAKNTLSMKEYQERMQGIYSSCVVPNTLDESPMAYKQSKDILQNLSAIHIDKILKPVYNFKATT